MTDESKPKSLDLEQALRNARIQVFGSVEQLADLYEEQRKPCRERGHHRINCDDTEDPQVCYDCELFFGKDDGIEYRIVPYD